MKKEKILYLLITICVIIIGLQYNELKIQSSKHEILQIDKNYIQTYEYYKKQVQGFDSMLQKEANIAYRKKIKSEKELVIFRKYASIVSDANRKINKEFVDVDTEYFTIDLEKNMLENEKNFLKWEEYKKIQFKKIENIYQKAIKDIINI